MDNINLENKYFKIDFKHNLKIHVWISSFILLAFIIILLLFFSHYLSQFDHQYQQAITDTLSQQLTRINQLNIENKNTEINKIIEAYAKNKYVLSLQLIDPTSQMLLGTTEKLDAQYNFIYNYLWKFTPEGDIIPYRDNQKKNDYLNIFFPIYNSQKTMDYIVNIKLKKYFNKPVYLPYIKIYINLIYILLFSLILFLILLADILIIILSKQFNKNNATSKKELLLKLYEYNLNTFPFKFNFEEGKFKNNFMADMIKYINNLIDLCHQKINLKQEENDKLKLILPPMMIKNLGNREKLNLIVKPEEVDYPKFLKELYFQNTDRKEISGYSTGLFYSGDDPDSDMLFKYINIDHDKKGFFTAKILESNAKKKILLLSLLNYIIDIQKENISKPEGFLSTINSLLNRLGKSELQIHALYAVLHTESNFIEIASTKFSPAIYYHAETQEFALYEFNSIPLGLKASDEFLNTLRKESFKLSPKDMVLLCDNSIENLYNANQQKLEVYALLESIKHYQSESAEVIVDKIKDKLYQFSMDFSSLKNLFILILKKSISHDK